MERLLHFIYNFGYQTMQVFEGFKNFIYKFIMPRSCNKNLYTLTNSTNKSCRFDFAYFKNINILILAFFMNDRFQQRIVNEEFNDKILREDEFEQCTFENCDFSSTLIQKCEFIDCNFINCNFSNTKLESSGLKDLHFEQCKLIGIDFSEASDFLFEVNFSNCILEFCNFQKKNCKKTKFIGSKVFECDFSETNLQESTFDNCDMSRSLFMHSNLQKADFRNAKNYEIDPENNRIHGAKFSIPEVLGLLTKYKIKIS